MEEVNKSGADIDVLEKKQERKEDFTLHEEVLEQVEEVLETVSIEGVEYNLDTRSISIRGQITPEIEEMLLKLPNLTEMFLHTSTYVPEGLTGLTKLYANYALAIPATLINLVELYANSVTELPDTFVNLERIHAHNILEIPAVYRHLENKPYNTFSKKVS